MTEKNRPMTTDHLIIRQSCWDDLEDFYRWERMPEVTEFFSIRDGQTKEDVIRKYLADEDDPAARQFTIMLKGEDDPAGDGGDAPQAGEPDGNAWQADGHGQTVETAPRNIGRIVLADIEPGWKAEIWRIYIGDTALRGKGYGKEAMLAMMEYCFGQLGLERLYLDHYTGNPAAYLYLSLGFQYEGVLRKNCRKNGVLYDVHLMSMLREEYEERYGKRNER